MSGEPRRPGSGAPGESLGGYVLEAKLGEGGMGVVWRARNPALPGVAFALKTLGAKALSGAAAQRFQREILTLGSLPPHPHLVRIHGGDPTGARPYYVMELVEGASLSSLAEGGRLPVRRAAEIVRACADAVAHIHAHTILHRDLKPDNVLVDREGRARICDFGLAVGLESERLTKTGAFLGTPTYAAPEQLRDSRHTDERTDVYSLGGILWFALAGRPPFEPTSIERLVHQVLNEPAAPPSRARPEVPRALDAICLQALEKDPAIRYASAAELRDDLDAFLAGRVPSASREQNRARTVRTALRASIVGFVLLVGAVGVALAKVRAKAVLETRVETVLAAKDAAALEAGLQGLAADHAPDEALLRVRRRLEEVALQDAAAPGAAAVKLRESAARLKRCGVSSETQAKIQAALVDAVARDLGKARGKEATRLRQDLAQAALECAGTASLVGEPGATRPLVDLLLDPSDPGSPERAQALVEARLAKRPDDLAARLLSAETELARAGAPVRALGPGRLRASPAGPIAAALAAASALPGAPGARAAWLLVDVRCGEGDAASARAALAAAVRVAPGAPERAAYEEVLTAAPPERDRAVALVGKLLEDVRSGAALAPFELARLFALWGEPEVVEAPELAAESGDAAIETVIAHDAPGRFDPRSLGPRTPQSLEGIARAAETIEVLKARRRPPTAQELEPLTTALARDIAASPLDVGLVAYSGAMILSRLSRPVAQAFYVAALADAPGSLTEAFDASYRSVASLRVERYSRDFELPPDEFARALHADVLANEPLQAAIKGGFPADQVEQSERGAVALRRIEELAENRSLSAGDRARLSFEALLGVEGYARLGGPLVLPIRAALRRQALAGPLGEGLAALDLERTARVVARVRDPLDGTHFLLLAAGNVAADAPPGSPCDRRYQKLADAAVAWIHALGVHHTYAVRQSSERDRAQDLENELSGMRGYIMRSELEALRKRLGDGGLARLQVTAEDREKLSKSVPAPFTPPR